MVMIGGRCRAAGPFAPVSPICAALPTSTTMSVAITLMRQVGRAMIVVGLGRR